MSNKKLIIENIASELKKMLEEKDMSFEDRKTVYDRIMEYKTSMMKTKPVENTDSEIKSDEIDREMFNLYFNRWKEETMILSDLNKVTENPDFLRIVGMGERAIPFIYEVIKNEPSFVVYILDSFYHTNLANGRFIQLSKYCRMWCDELKKKGY